MMTLTTVITPKNSASRRSVIRRSGAAAKPASMRRRARKAPTGINASPAKNTAGTTKKIRIPRYGLFTRPPTCIGNRRSHEHPAMVTSEAPAMLSQWLVRNDKTGWSPVPLRALSAAITRIPDVQVSNQVGHFSRRKVRPCKTLLAHPVQHQRTVPGQRGNHAGGRKILPFGHECRRAACTIVVAYAALLRGEDLRSGVCGAAVFDHSPRPDIGSDRTHLPRLENCSQAHIASMVPHVCRDIGEGFVPRANREEARHRVMTTRAALRLKQFFPEFGGCDPEHA